MKCDREVSHEQRPHRAGLKTLLAKYWLYYLDCCSQNSFPPLRRLALANDLPYDYRQLIAVFDVNLNSNYDDHGFVSKEKPHYNRRYYICGVVLSVRTDISLADVDGVSGGEGSTLACSASVALVSESTELSQEASLDCTAQRTGFWLLRLRFDDEDPDGIVALFDVIFTTKLVDEVSYSSRTSQESATLKVVELVSSITWSSTLKSSEFVLSSMLSPSSPTTTMPSPSSSSSSSSISPMCIPPSKPSSSSSSSIIPSEPDICLLSEACEVLRVGGVRREVDVSRKLSTSEVFDLSCSGVLERRADLPKPLIRALCVNVAVLADVVVALAAVRSRKQLRLLELEHARELSSNIPTRNQVNDARVAVTIDYDWSEVLDVLLRVCRIHTTGIGWQLVSGSDANIYVYTLQILYAAQCHAVLYATPHANAKQRPVLCKEDLCGVEQGHPKSVLSGNVDTIHDLILKRRVDSM
uniref:Uncharacterized protein n=1 Tax=Glossina austeni TaxID=7395 RepID=A0A1A9VC53_GLOAU